MIHLTHIRLCLMLIYWLILVNPGAIASNLGPIDARWYKSGCWKIRTCWCVVQWTDWAAPLRVARVKMSCVYFSVRQHTHHVWQSRIKYYGSTLVKEYNYCGNNGYWYGARETWRRLYRESKRRSNWDKGQRMMDGNLSEYGNLRGNCKLYRIWIR